VIPISKQQAEQRFQLAGINSVGVCYRLYSADDVEQLRDRTTPAIIRQPALLPYCTVVAAGLDPVAFSWIDEPAPIALETAKSELHLLGALTSDGTLTPVGKLAAELQLDLPVATLLLNACRQGFGFEALALAAILSVSDFAKLRGLGPVSLAASQSDMVRPDAPHGDLVELANYFKEWSEQRVRWLDSAFGNSKKKK